jgi:hypothetical protein
MFEFVKNFFTQKCDFCGKAETEDEPFVVEICTEAGIIRHIGCGISREECAK